MIYLQSFTFSVIPLGRVVYIQLGYTSEFA